MSYSTRYTIKSVTPSPAYDAPSFESRLTANGAPPLNELWSWYEHEVEIVQAMRESGATFVEIHGEGEDSDDVWDKQFTADDDDGRVHVLTYRYTLTRPVAPTSITEIKAS